MKGDKILDKENKILKKWIRKLKITKRKFKIWTNRFWILIKLILRWRSTIWSKLRKDRKISRRSKKIWKPSKKSTK